MNNNLDFLLIFSDWRYKLNVLENGELRAYLYISIGWGVINIDIFNVLHKHQRKGYGKRIIEELRKYYTITGESTESARFFWEAVGAEFTTLSDFIIPMQKANTFTEFKNPILIKTNSRYWGDMFSVPQNEEWETCAVVNLVGCTYSKGHEYDLIPFNNISPYEAH